MYKYGTLEYDCRYQLSIFDTALMNRPYWRCYYSNTDAVIFVIDSADSERIHIAKAELISMLEVCIDAIVVFICRRKSYLKLF